MEEDYKMQEGFDDFLAIELNNQTWELLEKKNRSKEEDVKMLVFAFGSQAHWFKAKSWKPINAQRGEWLIATVYASLNRGIDVLKHGKKCLEITRLKKIKGFDLASAYEIMSRGYAIEGDKENHQKYLKKAKDAGNKIEDKEDANYFFDALKAGNWGKFGNN